MLVLPYECGGCPIEGNCEMHDLHDGEFSLLLSINDTCLALGIGRNRVYDLIRERVLETRRVVGRHLVTVESVKRLAETGA